MERIHVEKVKEHVGKQVTIAGFAQVIRDQGSIKFLMIRDITGLIQVVVLKNNAEAMKVAQSLSMESVVEVTGLAKEEKQAAGGFEITVEKIAVLSAAEPELPIPIFEKGQQEEAEQSIRLDWRQLDLRKPRNAVLFRAWTALEEGFREYWVGNHYIEIHSPKLIATPSESGSEVFEVKYFDRKAYLAQSPQFYKQMAMAAGFEKVFEVRCFAPNRHSRRATERNLPDTTSRSRTFSRITT